MHIFHTPPLSLRSSKLESWTRFSGWTPTSNGFLLGSPTSESISVNILQNLPQNTNGPKDEEEKRGQTVTCCPRFTLCSKMAAIEFCWICLRFCGVWVQKCGSDSRPGTFWVSCGLGVLPFQPLPLLPVLSPVGSWFQIFVVS